jgi:plasmid stabilization system protein ParE
MRYRVIFRPEAHLEALGAAEYIACEASPEIAARWYEALEHAIASLETMPARCEYARERSGVTGIDLRQLVFHSHRLIFVIRDQEVHVLHVRPTAQDSVRDIG